LAEASDVLRAAVLHFSERADFKQNLQTIEAALAKKGKHP